MTLGLRLLLVCFGAAAIIWSSINLPAAIRFRALDSIAARVVRGEPFATKITENVLQRSGAETDDRLPPRTCRSVLVLRLDLLYNAMTRADRLALQTNIPALDAAARRALSCAPTDPLAWFALYWVENLLNGFSGKAVGYLETSYRYGPYEGWIGLKRNAFALAIFEQLSPETQQAVVREFVSLTNSGFVRETAANLMGPGWPIRDRLIGELEKVSLKNKTELARLLRRGGLELPIPDVSLPERRPWN